MQRNRGLLFDGFFSLKKKEKKIKYILKNTQNLKGVEGEILPAAFSAFSLYELVNVKIGE